MPRNLKKNMKKVKMMWKKISERQKLKINPKEIMELKTYHN
jgi:hypothetical protein